MASPKAELLVGHVADGADDLLLPAYGSIEVAVRAGTLRSDAESIARYGCYNGHSLNGRGAAMTGRNGTARNGTTMNGTAEA